MKKFTIAFGILFVLLSCQIKMSAQNQLLFEAVQTSVGTIELTWTVFVDVAEQDAFVLTRYDEAQTTATILDTIQSIGTGIQSYAFTDFGPFVNGSKYIYNLLAQFNNGNTLSETIIIELLANPHLISGQIGFDADDDCLLQTGEIPLPNWIVEASNGTHTYYGSSNTEGLYQILVEGDDTDYTIAVANNSLYLESCQGPSTVTVGFPGATTLDFPIQELISCTDLSVDLSAPFLRRCQDNIYSVHYNNNGVVTAEDAYIDLTLDESLSYISSTSTIPAIDLGDNNYRFEIGDLVLGESGFFYVTAFLDCDAEFGQTHCTTAHIFPDTICTESSSDWDGSSIVVSADCIDEEVVFTIRNVGSSDMSESLEYIVIQDNVMLNSGNFNLDINMQQTESFIPNGSTLRLEAEQAVGHPGISMPSVVVEGCGSPPFNTGFVTAFGEDDGNPFISIDCQENIDSYDPNDKRGFPKGYDDEHYIHHGQDLEYHIRFQNTGTAPALKVVIVDTLDKHLDFTSIQAGASSHDYRFEAFGEGVVQFVFDNINLPDSSANEAASHGFVKFRIAQREGLEDETLVENRAAIYFDFNAPILTNTTMHTVGEGFVAVSVDESPSSEIQTKVFPNPFSDLTTIQMLGTEMGTKTFQLYDVLGQIIRSESFTGDQFEFQRKHLQNGWYVFEIIKDGAILSSGKIIAH